MTGKSPFEIMMEESRQMAQEMAKAMNPALTSFDAKAFEAMWPTMTKEVMETFMGKTLNPDGLDAKTRLLLILQGLTIAGAAAESQIRLTIRHAVEAGATRQEVAETIASASVFGGVPAMTKAMNLAREVLDESEGPET